MFDDALEVVECVTNFRLLRAAWAAEGHVLIDDVELVLLQRIAAGLEIAPLAPVGDNWDLRGSFGPLAGSWEGNVSSRDCWHHGLLHSLDLATLSHWVLEFVREGRDLGGHIFDLE